MSNLALIEAAAVRAKGVVRRTPLLSSPFLDEIAGRRVFVKAECLQHTGSFKFRGAWSALTALPEEARSKGVIAYSSGNHAQGVAYAAKLLGVPALIVMPQDAPALKINNTKALGAEVVTYDRAGGQSREEIGAEISAARELTLVKPYDNDHVIAGQGTTGLEIAEDIEGPAEVLVCCGGGGLSAGIALALEPHGHRVRTVEPERFDDMARSLEIGARVSNNGPQMGLCDAILTPMPGERTFPILQRLAGAGLVVTDDEARRAMREAFVRLKLVIEPGGAVALAAALFHGAALEADTVVVTASGGNVDDAVFAEALA